jgi:hypothetical protein
MEHGLYTTAMKLDPDGAKIHGCETDFVVVAPSGHDHRIQIVIGECKNRQRITSDDVRNLVSVASAFPKGQYDVFIALTRLTPFSAEEIGFMRTINGQGERRAILMTERELEPYFVYERTKEEFELQRETAVTFGDMARITDEVFFQEKRRRIEPKPI